MSKLIPGDDLSVMLKQKDKNLERLLLELNAPALFAEFTRLQVCLENAEADQFRRMGG
jgi:hypothetical protein